MHLLSKITGHDDGESRASCFEFDLVQLNYKLYWPTLESPFKLIFYNDKKQLWLLSTLLIFLLLLLVTGRSCSTIAHDTYVVALVTSFYHRRHTRQRVTNCTFHMRTHNRQPDDLRVGTRSEGVDDDAFLSLTSNVINVKLVQTLLPLDKPFGGFNLDKNTPPLKALMTGQFVAETSTYVMCKFI